MSFPRSEEVEKKFEKGIFFSDFSAEFLGRNFKEGNFLGDAYQVSLGYQINFDLGVSGYPGLGFYASGNGAKVLENQFLGGFFLPRLDSGKEEFSSFMISLWEIAW